MVREGGEGKERVVDGGRGGVVVVVVGGEGAVSVPASMSAA